MSVKTEQGLMQHAGQQFGQGIPPSHSQYSPPEPTVSSSNSITSSLRLWRKKDSGDKKSAIVEAPTSSAGNETHVARVAPQTHYQSFSPNDVCRYTNSFPKDCSPVYKQPTPPVPVKYSEIVEPSPLQKIDQLSQAAQQKKDKDCIDMANNSQITMKPYPDPYGLKQHYPPPPPDPSLKQQYSETRPYMDSVKQPYVEPSFKFQYSENLKQSYHEQLKESYHDPNIPSQSQLHPIHKESQLYPYVPKETPLQQYISKYSIPYSRPYTVEQNNYLAHLNKIHPRMAQSIISDPHLRETAQVPLYHNLDHARPYAPVQRMYNHQAPPPMASNHPYPPHVNRNLPQHPYSYQQSYNMNVKQPPDAYRVPYQPNIPKYMPPAEQPLRNCSPRRPFNDNVAMQMNYPPVTPKISSPMYPPCSQLEYAQHYQHRREQIPDFYSTVGGYKSSFISQSPLAAEMTGDNTNTKSNALKQFLESWVDEDMSGLPDVVVSSNLDQEKFSIKAPMKRDEPNEPPLYILDTTEISSENLPQYMHLQQFEKLPENIKGYYHINKDAIGAERAMVYNGYMGNDKSSSTQDYNQKNQMAQENETRFVSEQVKAIGIQNRNEFEGHLTNQNNSNDSNEKVIQLHISDNGQMSHETQSVRSSSDFGPVINSTAEKVIQVHIRETQQNVLLVKPQSNNNFSNDETLDEQQISENMSNSACMYSNSNSEERQNTQKFKSGVNVLQHIVLSPTAAQSQQEPECITQESSPAPPVLEDRLESIENQSQNKQVETEDMEQTEKSTIKEETVDTEIKTETTTNTKTFSDDSTQAYNDDISVVSKEPNSEDQNSSNSQKNQVQSVIVSTYHDSVAKETNTEFEESIVKVEHDNTGVTPQETATGPVANPQNEIVHVKDEDEEKKSVATNVDSDQPEIKAEEQELTAGLIEVLPEVNALKTNEENKSTQMPDSDANSDELVAKEATSKDTDQKSTDCLREDSVKEVNENNVEQNREPEKSVLPNRATPEDSPLFQNIQSSDKSTNDNLDDLENSEILSQLEEWIDSRNETENNEDNQNIKEASSIPEIPSQAECLSMETKDDDNKIVESEMSPTSPQSSNDNHELIMSCSDETMTESEFRRAYKIEENNVLLQIGDDLIEINVSEKNGKKMISVKSLTDVLICNDPTNDKSDAKITELSVKDELIKETDQAEIVNYSEDILSCIEESCVDGTDENNSILNEETNLKEDLLHQEDILEDNNQNSLLCNTAGNVDNIERNDKVEEVTSSQHNKDTSVTDLELSSEGQQDPTEDEKIINDNKLETNDQNSVENACEKINEEPDIFRATIPEPKPESQTSPEVDNKQEESLNSAFCVTSNITETKTDEKSILQNDQVQNSLKLVLKKCKIESKDEKDRTVSGNIPKSKGEKKAYEDSSEKETKDGETKKYRHGSNEKRGYSKDRKVNVKEVSSKSSYLKQHSMKNKSTDNKSRDRLKEDKERKLKSRSDHSNSKKIQPNEKKELKKHQKRKEKSPMKPENKLSHVPTSPKRLSKERPTIFSPDATNMEPPANSEKPQNQTTPKRPPVIKPPRRSFNKQLSEDLLSHQVSKKKEEINFELIHNEIVIDHEFKICPKPSTTIGSPKDDSNKNVQEHRITSSTEKHDEEDCGGANKRRLSLEEYNRRKRKKLVIDIPKVDSSPKDADSATIPLETCSNLTDNLLLNITNNKKLKDDIPASANDIPAPVSSTEPEEVHPETPPKQYHHHQSRWANHFRSKNFEPVNTEMVKEYETLMQRFLKQEQLTVDELKKVKQIIRYKRWLQQQKSKDEIMTFPITSKLEPVNSGNVQQRRFELDINANEHLHLKDCDHSKSKDIDNQKTYNRVFEKSDDSRDKRRNRKRFRNLYTDGDDSDCDEKSDAKKTNVETVKSNDYSVHQSDSHRALKLVFKRSVSNNSSLQPVVWLERSDSLDQLAKNYS